ncbi:MAG: glycosyltransferase [Nonomuraea sp.]|nr:glycosyltransferase [Nonomuraea sp.]
MSLTPLGFMRTPEKGLVRLRAQEAADVESLRSHRGVELEWPDQGRPIDEVMRLAAAGIPITAADVPDWLPADLAALLADRAWLAREPDGAWVPREPDGTVRDVADLRREEHSVRLRRLAHRHADEPAVSVVMSTKRPHLVAHALSQMARQRGVRVEVLLGLHGAAFPAVRQAVEDSGLPVEWIEAEQDVPFGEVLNKAAALASGDYLAKWDDDDWYGPDHLADLIMAAGYSGADIVGTTGEFFYLKPLDATIRRTTFASGAAYPSEVFDDHVAGGTILLPRTTFNDLGGFPALPRAVDLGFLKAARESGATVYRTHGLNYVLRRSLDDHTWQLPLAHFLKVATHQWHGFRPSLLMESA